MASPFDTLFGGSTAYTPSPSGLSADWMLDPAAWLDEVRRLQQAQVDAAQPPVPTATVRPSPPLYSAGSIATPEADSLMPPSAFTGIPPIVAPPPGVFTPAPQPPASGKLGAPEVTPSPTPAPLVEPPSLGLTPGQVLAPGVGVGGAFQPQAGLGQPRAPGGPIDVPGFIERLIQIESDGDPNKLSPSGRYRGLGQFSPDLEQRYGITDWRNPDQQRRGLAQHVAYLQRQFEQRFQRPPTEGELYLMHQQGEAGGPALLAAPPGTSAFDAIRRFYGSDNAALTAIFNNLPDGHPLKRGLRTLPGGRLPTGAEEVARAISASDFASLWTRRFDGSGPPPAPSFTPTSYTPGADIAALNAEGFVPGQMPPVGGLPGTGLPPGGLRPSSAPAPYTGAGGPQAPVLPPQRTTLASLLGMRQPPVAGNVWEAMLGSPSPTAFLGAERQGAAAIMAAGQRLRLENPGASEDMLMRMLMRDPAWGLHAINLGPQAATIMRNAISPPPQQEGAFTIGSTRYDASGKPIVTGTPVAPDQQRLAEWLMSLPPEQRATALSVLQARQQPSDREQAAARIDDARRRGVAPSIHDLQIMGYLQRVPQLNAAGATIGERVFDMFNQRYLTPGETTSLMPVAPPGTVPPPGAPVTPPGQPGTPGTPPVAPGAPGTPVQPVGPPPPTAGLGLEGPVTPPRPTSIPGITTTTGSLGVDEPITPSRLADFRQQLEQFGYTPPGQGFGPMSLFEAMGAQFTPGTRQSVGTAPVGQRPAAEGPAVEVGPPPTFTATPRVFRRPSGAEFTDVPELSLRSPLIEHPEYMFTGVGVAERATRLATRLFAQIPGLEASGEAAQTRGTMLASLGAAVAAYNEGVRLAGEHASMMATVPGEGDFWSNPVRALGQAIELRRKMVTELEQAIRDGGDQNTSETSRSQANIRAQRIRAVLNALPSMESMLTFRERLMAGAERAPTLDVPGLFGDATKAAKGAIGEVTGGAKAPESGTTTGIPEDLSSPRITTDTLSKLLDRPNISAADIIRIQDELMRRIRARGATKGGQ